VLQYAPAMVVAAVLALSLVPSLIASHGNATGFVSFGRAYVAQTHPPAGALIRSSQGYDGQYFWAQAKDPLLLSAQTVNRLGPVGFRLQRVAYPLAAFLLAGGHEAALPWTLLAVNVFLVLMLTLAFARFAGRAGWSPWWALVVGLLPGFIVATWGDMSDVMATGAMLCGLIAWSRGRRALAAGSLTLAVLSREPMMLAVVAIAAEAAAGAWRARGRPGEPARILRAARPVVMVPVAAFLAWQVYLILRLHGAAGTPMAAYQLPFTAIVDEVSKALRSGSALGGGWDIAYLTVMLTGIAVALRNLRRGVGAAGLTAALFGLSLLVVTFGNDWSYTRLSAPMFAALLFSGLQRKDRSVLALCAVLPILGLLSPLVLV
jgi:hypothetical protein